MTAIFSPIRQLKKVTYWGRKPDALPVSFEGIRNMESTPYYIYINILYIIE